MATMTTAEIIAKFPGYKTMDPNAVQADFAATGGAGKADAGISTTTTPTSLSSSNSLSGAGAATPQTDFSTYLDNYQGSLLDLVTSSDTSAPAAKTSYTPDELAAALVSKGGYNETDARNAANNAGGRADQLAKEFLGVGAEPAKAASSGLTFDNIKSQLTPGTSYPAPINRVGEFNLLRDQMGVTDMESLLNTYKANQREIDAQLRTDKTAERGKPVAMNVIQGRISKETQTAQENYDFVSRQIASVTDQLNTAYSVINTTMNFENLDYQDAVTKYNTEFNQNLQVIDLMRGLKKDAITEQQRQIDNARANLTIYTNAITNGNLDPSTMSSDQKAMLSKLEAQSGLPVGFTASLGLSAKDKIVSTSTANGVTTVITTDAAGNLSMKKIGTSTVDTGTTATLKALKADVAAGKTLDEVENQYRKQGLSPDLIYTTYNSGSPAGHAKESADYLKSTYNITVGDSNAATPAKSTAADISTAKQKIISNGGTDADLAKADNDPNFVAWILATYP